MTEATSVYEAAGGEAGMLALAQAQAQEAGPISVETLAHRQDLPRKFLEAIVANCAPPISW